MQNWDQAKRSANARMRNETIRRECLPFPNNSFVLPDLPIDGD